MTNDYPLIAVNRNYCEPTKEGKIADPELHFSGGPLDGLKLTGFALWQRPDGSRFVTLPANLQPISDAHEEEPVQRHIRLACEDRGLTVADPPSAFIR